MATSPTNPGTVQPVELVPPVRTLLNLDTFEDVTLIKHVPPFMPVSTAAEAMARINNDQTVFLAFMNQGLQNLAKKEAIDDPANPWLEVDEDGTETPFTGTAANKAIVNKVIAGLAFSFGYDAKMKPEEKKAIKTKVRDLIKNTPAILDSLRKTAGESVTAGE